MLEDKERQRINRIIELGANKKLSLQKIADKVNDEFGSFFGDSHKIYPMAVQRILREAGIRK